MRGTSTDRLWKQSPTWRWGRWSGPGTLAPPYSGRLITGAEEGGHQRKSNHQQQSKGVSLAQADTLLLVPVAPAPPSPTRARGSPAQMGQASALTQSPWAPSLTPHSASYMPFQFASAPPSPGGASGPSPLITAVASSEPLPAFCAILLASTRTLPKCSSPHSIHQGLIPKTSGLKAFLGFHRACSY